MNYTLYTVMPGNTLWGIANFFGTTVEEIVSYNDIENPEFIIPGLVLKIPATIPPDMPAVYIVRPGDSLWTVANRYGLKLHDLKALNKIDNPNMLYPGQKLKLK